jgi:glycosyltransferase involved in cell wall biosynthesis
MADVQLDDRGRPSDVHGGGATRPRVLFICADPVGEEMAGLGIRCWELARALAEDAKITIAHGGSEEGEREGVRIVAFRPHEPHGIRELVADADAIVAHPQWPLVDRWLRRSSARIVIDLYCPETLETLELLAGERALARRQLTATTLDRLHSSLRTGHNFVCASETQRDLWLGAMLGLRLIDPGLYDRDPGLRDVIDLVPFGVPEGSPRDDGRTGPREAIPAIREDGEIVLWNGGIWSWLDAETAIRAAGALSRRRPTVQLVFMGAAAGHPAAAASAESARRLADELGLLGSVVHFHDSWVPYAERAAWLMQSACALSTHAEHLESRFAYRTRLLDCFWAGLPVVCTSGDDLAGRVERERLGAVAPPGDAELLSAALERVLENGREAYGSALRATAERQTWRKAAEPLARWIAEPRRPPRPGDAPGALRRPLAQRLREGAYLLGGRSVLARRRRRPVR